MSSKLKSCFRGSKNDYILIMTFFFFIEYGIMCNDKSLVFE